MDGILPLWKPKGFTSHDCVYKVRKLFGTKKVGHTGTLDPDAEGVLPICIGKATKIVPFLTDTKKVYKAELKLGIATTTEDASGEIIAQKAVSNVPTEDEINTVFAKFTGEIEQIPPMYSAVKVKGKKLYEYARNNETVERPIRRVEIYELVLLSPPDQTNHALTFRVSCSKGTYIRTLCVDIGKELGYPSHMSLLIREATGAFSHKNAVTFATIEEAVKRKQETELLYPIQAGLPHLDQYFVDQETAKKVFHGQKLPRIMNVKTDPFIMMHKNEAVAIYKIHPDQPEYIKPVRVFSR
ncbi:tRNA pseudouridine(55) synthase TruB [Cerasibacillus sp. JNUCC 74]